MGVQVVHTIRSETLSQGLKQLCKELIFMFNVVGINKEGPPSSTHTSRGRRSTHRSTHELIANTDTQEKIFQVFGTSNSIHWGVKFD
jgi:hypothetical protein